MSNNINWEIMMLDISNISPQEIIRIVNSLLALDFKDSLETWLNEQVENENLKGFKKNKYPNKYPFYPIGSTPNSIRSSKRIVPLISLVEYPPLFWKTNFQL